MKTHIYTHPSFLEHDTGVSHPECMARLEVILELFAEEPFNKLPLIEAREAELEWLYRAHTEKYVTDIREAIVDDGCSFLDTDTTVSPKSWEAALRAAGSVCQAVDDIFAGRCDRAFCAVRPPGHHALSDKAMGFCIFNNIFVGARYAQDKYDVDRIAIVDFDVHHGNGTDAMARAAENIFYVSSHQFPWYPGSGDPQYDIPGKILNVPLVDGAGSAEFRDVYENIIFPALEDFAPQLLMISAGFDAHRDDPLAGLGLIDDDYSWVTKKLCAIAEKHGQGKIIAALEGGYNLEALKSSVSAHVKALAAI